MVDLVNMSHISTPESSLENRADLVLPSQASQALEADDTFTEALHTEPRVEASQTTKPHKNPVKRFLYDADYRNIGIGSINAILHTLATISSLGSHSGSLNWLKPINKLLDQAAFICTRWIAPTLSYGFATFKAFKNKEGIKTLIKLIPPVFLPFVGDANIDTVYGTSAALNQPYDMIEDRIKFLLEKHPELAPSVQEANKTFSGNCKLMWGVLKQMCHEFVQGRMPKEEALFFTNCLMILGGSIPMMLFAPHSRNTTFAKVLGLLRNAGGIVGDIGFVWFDRQNIYKLMIATMCGTSACASVVKRWLKSDTVARTLIHLSAALDVSAYSLWNAYNDKSQSAKGRQVQPEVVQAKLAQLADTKTAMIKALAT